MIIRLFHTNDLHSHVEALPKQSTFLKKAKAQALEKHEPFVLVDMGDHMDRANPITEATLGRANVTLLNKMAYTIVTIGNNEGITFTKEELEKAYRDRHFSVVLANLFEPDGTRPTWALPELILTVEGIKIGFIGVTADFTEFYQKLGWTIKHPMETVQQALPKLRERADVVVVLSHVGKPFDLKMARELDGIDVIIGSHTHDLLPNGLVENSTLIVQAGKFGRHVGEVVIHYNKVERSLTKLEAGVHSMEEVPDDAQLKALINEEQRQAIGLLQKPFVTIEETLSIDWDQPSPFASFLSDALKEWTGAEIGMINSGVLLDALEKGPLSRLDLHRLCPHPLNPCRLSLSGRAIKDLILVGESDTFKNWALLGLGFRGTRLGGLVFSGLTYRWESHKNRLEAIQINGEPLNENRVYTIGTSDMFSFAHLAPPLKEVLEMDLFMPEFLRDVLAWKLQKTKLIR